MRFTFEVLVTLKPGLADPQGKAVEASLPALGLSNVSDVHVGQAHAARRRGGRARRGRARRWRRSRRRLLSNPVIEDFRVLEGAEAAPAAGDA